ncbi:PAS domain S-box-containing protein/diguanylate cyclase (GGDEF) domain-containing protein [Chromohalobacter canadensis]|uniref:PAS domain S-box-containing protein/diguanylate cyclase (GGDEF) domain-containing protein n=1 Tax=Chromohalobacter canadensis TaxID=141389 RepID=A0A285VV19_9GAMM|nr:GGDEF domain-containing phosphodiesterase [Chromohalobacter canadensis]SOC57884.1 PAS domain S-box-containing protein/diguanylate cyclase (GGDEF) domain-containing protein [Chromohalobacter canadensis]
MSGHDVAFRRWLVLRCHKLARRWQRFRARCSEAQSGSARDDIELVRRQYLESEQRFRSLLESLPRVAVQGYDRERRVIYWNEASTKLYGYGAAEAQGQPLEELIIPESMREPVIQAHRAWMREGIEIPAEELELQHKSGEPVSVFSHHVMLGEHTENPLMFCVDVDLSAQKRAYRELDFATRFDALTCLPNRQTFEVQLDEVIVYCRRQSVGMILIYLDIDDFVAINDALSYEQGDRLLVELSRRLHQVMGASDIMSRLSGDEFVIAFPMFQRKEVLLQLVHKIQEVFRSPFLMDGSRHQVTACLGISLYPDNGETAHELIRNADVAKNRAKLDGHGSVCFFDQKLHDQLLYQHRLVDRLTKALDSGELSLHYQPQVSAASGRIENLEALLRWQPVEGPPISPAEFIPLAERSGLIHRLGDWVMETACQQRVLWRNAGLDIGRIDINFSGRQMSRPDIFQRFEDCLTRHGLGPQDIGLELTENVLIEADEHILEGLRRLHDLGFRIAIDDFGTGYSSLSYLKHFPVTALKIDRTFVRDAPEQPKDRAIMEAAIFIGHRLGLEVVAEGVENREQLALIREMRCDLVQGFYFFRPMPALEMERVLGGLVTGHPGVSG